MNDSSFSSYDNYFCGNAFQDLSISHISEAEQSNALHYFNTIPSDLQTQQSHHLQFPTTIAPITQIHQTLPQQSAINATISALQCNINNNISGSNCNTTAIGSNSNHNNSNNNALNNLPFVQIHTTDVHPPRNSYGNVFRRNPTSQEEIKSEPIKSESAETNTKETTNNTPTPPPKAGSSRGSNERLSSSTNAICPDSQLSNVHQECNNAEETINDLPSAGVTAIPKVSKCSRCSFISLSEAGIEQHTLDNHSSSTHFSAESPKKISCPGCENTFQAHKSFYVHLCEDHRMCLDEANKLLQAVVQLYPHLSNEKHSDKLNANVEHENKETQPKIYLKNVECLREPRREVLDEQQSTTVHLNESNYFGFEDSCPTLLANVDADNNNINITYDRNLASKDLMPDVSTNANKNRPKQKISIKSVDVLREPALLRRDLEIQNLNFLTQCNEHELQETLENENQYVYSNTLENNHSMVCDNSDESLPKEINTFEKPRRPKIYIKNVDILKEPLVLSTNLGATDLSNNSGSNVGLDFNFMSQTMQQNAGTFLSNAETVTTQSQVFDSTGSQLNQLGNLVEPFLYDGSNNNFLQNISDLDTFSLTATHNSSNSNNYLLESPKYHTDLQQQIEESTPIITEPTPPPLPVLQQNQIMETSPAPTQNFEEIIQPKQKIFIKNVDILKQPQFQEHRRTLHLRTVDELNLMNKTEVENLIAPHLDATQNSLHQEYNERNNNMHISSENSKNSEETLYDNLNLKLNEGDNDQTLNNWANDYSLVEDLDCIITEHTESVIPNDDESMVLQKQLYDLDTPQMSVISIRDIEEIADEQNSGSNCLLDHQLTNAQDEEIMFAAADEMIDSSVVDAHNSFNAMETATETFQNQNIEMNLSNSCHSMDLVEISSELKREQNNTLSTSSTPVTEKPELVYDSSTVSTMSSIGVPMSFVMTTSCSSTTAVVSTAAINKDTNTCLTTSLPVPPLVPVSNLVDNNRIQKTRASSVASAPEKGRIYVADNLMEISATSIEKPLAVSVTGGTSNRGRPFGANRTGITKIRKLYGNAAAIDVGMKCNVQGCAFRFKKSETLEYHKRCHTGSTTAAHSMICPECKTTNFSNWNTLHTHLWRTHQIDMELYSCTLCQFKTPIYSRLVNTHSKIHSDERNYKCDQCDKAFKNSKQLKNHRRWHRNAATGASTSTTAAGASAPVKQTTVAPLHRCNDCGSAFSHQKTLREHICKENSDVKKVMRCEICERVVSSKSSLKLHMLTHEAATRFKCDICEYRANDHNAFRRHKMTHDKSKMYICPYCDYKSIQSVAYQKHIQQKHPESADNIVLKCSVCSFSTINRSLLNIHMAKHENNNGEVVTHQHQIELSTQAAPTDKLLKETLSTNNADIAKNSETDTGSQQQQQSRNKIKVKSDLVLTDPTKFSKNTHTNSMNTLLVQCFDNAIT